ncbi:MAG: helix-turn-helix transcriptional regulator [Eubacterium sp.]|nr:helix-turn-helix transcriptional regulator [Eubacterium sp.]
MSVGENIRNARQKAGLTQAYLAELAGVTQAMLCQIERGTKNPSLQLGAEIAKILNCSLDSLLIGSGPSD